MRVASQPAQRTCVDQTNMPLHEFGESGLGLAVEIAAKQFRVIHRGHALWLPRTAKEDKKSSIEPDGEVRFLR